MDNDKESPSGFRLYGALFTLLALTSLRFGDTRKAQALWSLDTALCGLSVNNKDRPWRLMNWATPLLGISPKSKWFGPVVKFWNRTKPKDGKGIRSLFPHVCPGRKIDYEPAASYGVAMGRLSALGAELGFPNVCKLRPFRKWRQRVRASYVSTETKERPWATGARVEKWRGGRYDKAVCAA